jgi:predicted Zn-dependent peptidase
VLLDPLKRDRVFIPEYVEGEKANLIDLIRSQINDKRTYARNRLTELMCEKEPYGVNALGDEVSASMITPGGLYSQYREILAGSRVELFYCGSAPLSQVSEIIALALSELPREGVPSVFPQPL